MKAIKEIPIYIIQKHNVKQIDVVQFDTGVQLVFTVQDFTIPTGATATLYVQKPSGKFVFQEDGITITGNKITVNLENQAITEHGKVPYQVSITSGADVITTFTGLIMVEKSLKDAGATESKTVIKAFDEAVSDHVAEFQTKAEQIVQACIATIPADYTAMEEKVNETANAVKGYLSGAVVRADDVSPVEHSPVVRVHGKNLLRSDQLVPKPEYVDLYSSALSVYDYRVEENKTYTISFDTENTGKLMYVNPNSGFDYAQFRMDGQRHSFTKKMTKTVANSVYQLALVSIAETSDVACGTISNVQLEEGSTATAYTPYIDPSAVTVTRCGKNILKSTITNRAVAGLDFTVDGSSQIVVNGAATSTTYTPVGSVRLKAGKTYMLSGCPSGGTISSYRLDLRNTNTSLYEPNVFDYGDGVLFMPKEDVELVVGLRFAVGAVFTNLKFRPMVTVANAVDLVYEPYNGTEYTPSADGTVPGITSLSPSMTILTDTEGVIVECEYNRDTNKVIEKMTNAIIALGGTI